MEYGSTPFFFFVHFVLLLSIYLYLRRRRTKLLVFMTIIYPSPIFGPVHSRRLGVSLGINLLPADGKVCSFDCIYCECGFNADHRPNLPMPTREEVYEALEAKLKDMIRISLKLLQIRCL